MRNRCKLTTVAALLIPLAGSSCARLPDQPVAAQLSETEANVLAQRYLDQEGAASPRVVTLQEQQEDGWWLFYQTPFDASARPPKVSYFVQVRNDGTVRHVK